MNCQFKKQGDKFVCKDCGFTTRFENMKVNCLQQTPEKSPPSLLKRAANLGKATARHFSTGMKHCSEEQMKARYEQCQKNECRLFRVLGQGGVCAHDDCGCLLSTNRKFLSKLSWASSKCPEGYWGPIEEKDSENTENGV